MSEASTVHVSGISAQTTDSEVQEFFSFCGKITSISVTPVSSEKDSAKSASVTFEKAAAAKTALLLDQTQLGTSTVHVESAQSLDDIAGRPTSAGPTGDLKDENGHDVAQEDKPRSRIIAEYLAHGYAISDTAIQKAISLDQKHGFSSKFTSALSNFDSKLKASDRARGLDESYKISDKAASGWRGLHTYFEKALGTPSGQKLREFYAQTDKQVRDIHAEARRLADLKASKTAAAGGEAAPQAADSGSAANVPVANAAPEVNPTAPAPSAAFPDAAAPPEKS
ncbi:putative actin cytoskeleton protein [Aspergillus taichungensis]|uniref:Putative actin cytoskeleton protein n=1 Tax=Aspergillus taichungensis TaxID=482145 RepID=A0A2J5HVL4_9EURO|nr:putative actin cytoskeleton protein [Aspergillus taichungensis]